MNNEERRAIVQVTDKPIELQSMVQTVFTFMILGLLSWIGVTLEDVRDNTFENNKNIALFSKDLGYQSQILDTYVKKLDGHIADKEAHRK